MTRPDYYFVLNESTITNKQGHYEVIMNMQGHHEVITNDQGHPEVITNMQGHHEVITNEQGNPEVIMKITSYFKLHIAQLSVQFTINNFN